jgi:transposase-like protein
MKIKCPRCFSQDFWKTNDGRLKCKHCRYIFTPKPNPFNLPDGILKEIISEFVLEHSTNIILERVNISKYKLIKILAVLRRLMKEDIPEFFREPNHFPVTEKFSHEETSIFGIARQEGKIYAQIIKGVEAKDLKFLRKRGGKIPNFFEKYTGIAFKGNLYRLASNEKHRIDSLEGFWGYLKRKLAAKGGIRKERLPLYLAEYVWRYNHRKLSLKERERILFDLLSKYFEELKTDNFSSIMNK